MWVMRVRMGEWSDRTNTRWVALQKGRECVQGMDANALSNLSSIPPLFPLPLHHVQR